MADEAKSYGRKKQLLTTFLSAWIQSNFMFYSKYFASSIWYTLLGAACEKKSQKYYLEFRKKKLSKILILIYFNFN